MWIKYAIPGPAQLVHARRKPQIGVESEEVCNRAYERSMDAGEAGDRRSFSGFQGKLLAELRTRWRKIDLDPVGSDVGPLVFFNEGSTGVLLDNTCRLSLVALPIIASLHAVDKSLTFLVTPPK